MLCELHTMYYVWEDEAIICFKYWQLLYHLVLTELVSRRLCAKMNVFSDEVFTYFARVYVCVCVLLLKFERAYCSANIKNPVLGSPRFRMQTPTHWNRTPYVCGVTRCNFADSQYSVLSSFLGASYSLTNAFGGKGYQW
jgi:hypothetical protein